MNAIRSLLEAGQSLWLDNTTRHITGLTSNPSIFDRAIGSGADDELLAVTEKASAA